jgi:sugar O-acyltransferase (sialic acid O-acetyltransferase NeuD family)
MNKKQIIIFGTGEIAEIAAYYFTHDSDFDVIAFTADDEFINQDSFQGKPLIPFSKIQERYPPDQYSMHVALSYQKLNQVRESKYHQAKRSGYKLVSYVSSKAIIWPDLTLGDNCFILEGQNIQPTVKIGNNVMLWSCNHIGHGSVIHDHVYLASHICISGHCTIGERTFIGVNATTRDFCSIGKDCFIAMGADITQKIIPDGSSVLAAKSALFNKDHKITKKIMSGYFHI